MSGSTEHLSPSEATRRLGISGKALRLYEQRGMIVPLRSKAGWRVYGPDAMARAAEIVALRALGFGLAQIARILHGDSADLEPVLAAHQSRLEDQIGALATATEKVRRLRAALARGETPAIGEIVALAIPARAAAVSFALPWPWGGEIFALAEIRPITHITGPLFSGKTRLAQCLAAVLPDAVFIGLDRLADGTATSRARYDRDNALRASVDRVLDGLIDDGATRSDALFALLVSLEANARSICVIDMLEQGLDERTQKALIEFLRRRADEARPIFFLTRSTAILDLDLVGSYETILYCPANHSMPIIVAPIPGTAGYDLVASCLASPDVRARTDGVIAVRPSAA